MVVNEVSMPETLGARLRQRREERGIALAAIAQQTKIKQCLFDGLENDDLSQWPSKLYRRAFVRAYARAIGLDPDTVVQEFLQAHPDPPEVDIIAAMSSAARAKY
jgi:cytoskeletal protein RodZ